MQTFACPHCNHHIQVQAQHLGVLLSCPLCRGQFTTSRPAVSDLSNPRDEANVFDSYTNVKGISKNNPGGISRQIIAAQCHIGEYIMLIFERGNPYDPNAIRVCRSNGEQLGYIDRYEAFDMREAAEYGTRYDVYISQILGGTPGKPNYGIELKIFEFEEDDLKGVDEFINNELAENEITPLFRPSPYAIERSQIKYITVSRD